jgi:plastocyanin
MDGRRRGRLCAAAGITLVAGTILSASPASASGGGGCGRPVSDGPSTTVTIRVFCFTPTVARVQPGQAVTFVNRDGFAHTVLGANGVWGSFDLLRGGQEVTYRFARTGIYSYVCTIHPGMVGTVVVGNGRGPGAIGTTTAAGPVTLVPPSSPPDPAAGAVPRVSPVQTGPWPVATFVALGMFFLAVAALALERRRRVRA